MWDDLFREPMIWAMVIGENSIQPSVERCAFDDNGASEKESISATASLSQSPHAIELYSCLAISAWAVVSTMICRIGVRNLDVRESAPSDGMGCVTPRTAHIQSSAITEGSFAVPAKSSVKMYSGTLGYGHAKQHNPVQE